MNLRYVIYGALLAFCVGFLTARETIEPEVRTEYREVKVKEVVTIVEEKKREERRPDGTVVIETETRTDKRSETQRQTDAKESVTPSQPDWSIGAYTDTKNIVLTIERRILGDLWAGVYARTQVSPEDLEVGVGLSYSF